MDFNTISKTINSAFKLKNNGEKEIQIITGASYPTRTPISLFLVKVKEGWVLSDKKQTLRMMNNIYELRAPDVKNCINAVLRIYGFKLSNGMIYIEIQNEQALEKRIFDMLMCIGQLVNMYAFFDAPDKQN